MAELWGLEGPSRRRNLPIFHSDWADVAPANRNGRCEFIIDCD
jgi:hypothetical protein